MEMMNNPYKVGNQGQMNPYPGGYPMGGMAPGFTGFPGFNGGAQPSMMPGGAPMAPPMSGTNTPGSLAASPAGTTGVNVPGMLPIEQSFIENILRLNLGKIATIYMTFENNSEWNAKIFKGRLEAAGRDHIIISDPQTGMRFLLLMVNLDYITFDEELNYSPQFGGTARPGVGR